MAVDRRNRLTGENSVQDVVANADKLQAGTERSAKGNAGVEGCLGGVTSPLQNRGTGQRQLIPALYAYCMRFLYVIDSVSFMLDVFVCYIRDNAY